MYFKKGIAFYEIRKYNEALDSFEKAIKINGDMPDYWSYKQEALMKLGKTAEAARYNQTDIYNNDKA